MSNKPPDGRRRTPVELTMADVGVGWAEFTLAIGDSIVGPYLFSMVWGPCPDIRRFAEELDAGKMTKMVLRGEPGAIEVNAEPIEQPGWVRLQIWHVDYRGVRTLDFETTCSGADLAASMRRNIGFLATEQSAQEAGRPRRGFWRRLSDWLIEN